MGVARLAQAIGESVVSVPMLFLYRLTFALLTQRGLLGTERLGASGTRIDRLGFGRENHLVVMRLTLLVRRGTFKERF